MALDFSKINNEIVRFFIRDDDYVLKRNISFREFIKDYQLESYREVCQKLERNLKSCEEGTKNSATNSNLAFDFSMNMLAIHNSLRLIRENYGLQILAEAGLLPKYLFE